MVAGVAVWLVSACVVPLVFALRVPGKTLIHLPEENATPAASFDLHWPGSIRGSVEGFSLENGNVPRPVGEVPLCAGGDIFTQTGTASWYGEYFHGRPTAAGETFDMNELTAAHLTLPLGSFALIRNVTNNKRLVVKINDRGPFIKGRIIDVSYGAAKQLGFIKQGKAKVEVRPLSRKQVRSLNPLTGGSDKT